MPLDGILPKIVEHFFSFHHELAHRAKNFQVRLFLYFVLKIVDEIYYSKSPLVFRIMLHKSQIVGQIWLESKIHSFSLCTIFQ